MKNYRIRITGKVQGVFFRASTLRMANEFGLTGWVKNEIDGSVLISADGDTDKLKQLLDWCKEGPEFARVNSVNFQEDEPGGFKGFVIIR